MGNFSPREPKFPSNKGGVELTGLPTIQGWETLNIFGQEIYHKIVTHCLDSLAIRLQPKDLKHLNPRPVRPGLQG